MHKNDNMLDALGKKPEGTSAEGSGSPESSQQSLETGDSEKRGADLMSAGSKSESAATDKAGSAEDTTKSGEASAKPDNVTNPDTWSKDSALKEVKKLREENKASRLKYEEMVSKYKAEMEAREAEKEAEYEALRSAKSELDNIKEKEADKKRSLEDKLAHREAIVAELKAQTEQREAEFKSKLDEMQSKLASFQAEAEAQMEVYKQRLDSELQEIPEKYKSVADLIIKGAGDHREALIAIQEAKLLNTFGEKKVHVVNNTPGVGDGARANKEKLENAANAEKSKMSSSQKIAEGLKAIRSGTPNSAYRNR